MEGKLIAIEGLDGSGKATQAGLLCGALSGKGAGVRKVSFPNYEEPSSALVRMYLNGEFGKNPNDVSAYAASSFYAVDRYASYKKHWCGDYRGGALIVADRYTTSNIVFQLSKLPREQWGGFIAWVEDFEYDKLGLPKPDLTLYLDMPPAVSQKLMLGRYHGDEKKKDIHERNTAFLDACRVSAAYAADRLGWKVIRCAGDEGPRTVEAIHGDILRIVLEEFPAYASV